MQLFLNLSQHARGGALILAAKVSITDGALRDHMSESERANCCGKKEAESARTFETWCDKGMNTGIDGDMF